MKQIGGTVGIVFDLGTKLPAFPVNHSKSRQLNIEFESES